MTTASQLINVFCIVVTQVGTAVDLDRINYLVSELPKNGDVPKSPLSPIDSQTAIGEQTTSKNLAFRMCRLCGQRRFTHFAHANGSAVLAGKSAVGAPCSS
jgi:hypothetical protein